MTERTNEAALWPTAHQAIMAGQSPEIPGAAPKSENDDMARAIDAQSYEPRTEIDEWIDRAAEALGIEPLPWQREWLRAHLSGQKVVMHRGRRTGWTTVQRMAEHITPPASPTQPAANQEPGA